MSAISFVCKVQILVLFPFFIGQKNYWQQIQGNWRQFVGAAKQRWAKITDNDLMECQGDRDKLVGKLQELYGISADKAGEEIAHIEQHLKEAREGGERMYGGSG